MKSRYAREGGAVNGPIIAMIAFGVVALALAVLSAWLYSQYVDQKSNVDSKISAAVAKAERDQAESDETKFAQREKEPNREFVGPDDYGRLTFSYPKTWSNYVATDEGSGSAQAFQAYLNPVYVPPVSTANQRFALRVLIENKDYDAVVKTYDAKVKKGDLKSSPFTVNGQTGTRLDGNFSQQIRGAVVIFKLRDKTISIFTDADTFKPDFENIIKTIKFNG